VVRPVDVILDIGAGIRPQQIIKAKRHICIEPHHEYASWLRNNGYEVIERNALEALSDVEPVESIFLLDVIEHLEKSDGQNLLRAAMKKATQQIVVFTPLGFQKQEYAEGEKDAWGMNGTHWQTHRSGWVPDEFHGWKIHEGVEACPAFFAVWG
jgi:hypothetical protein